MPNQLETRVRRLEAKRNATGSNIFRELSSLQLRSLLILLDATEKGIELGCSSAELINDDLLWRNAMSRETYDNALGAISQTQWERMVQWVRPNS